MGRARRQQVQEGRGRSISGGVEKGRGGLLRSNKAMNEHKSNTKIRYVPVRLSVVFEAVTR